MTPRITVSGVGLDHHGALDHRQLDTDAVKRATASYDEIIKGLLAGVERSTVELARLRNARHQQCRLCMSLRSSDALEQGLDEDKVAAAYERRTEGLSPREAAAVMIADAFLTDPAGWSATDWATVTDDVAFSEDEVAEIVLKLTQFSRNKVRVSLGFDQDEVRVRSY